MLVEHSVLSREYASWGRLHRAMMATSIAATYRIADVVVAVSKGSAIDTGRLAAMTHDRIKAVYNPIRQRPMPERNETRPIEKLWNCPPGQRILTVGSLKYEKNHPLLLRAFALLTHPDARLMLLGQGKGEAILRNLAAELGIADRVIFSGFHPDPSPFYATADLFVLSSDYEGFGNVIVEALSFGLPVVSTDCPSGPAEILENGRFGMLVPVGNAEKLSEGIERALQSSHDTDTLISRAADFSPSIAAQSYLDLLFEDA
jgi:glycosyltransferase involved in cell wall biosynthesis